MGRIKDMTDMKVGFCHVVSYAGLDKERRALWKCICDCGNAFIARGKDLRNGSTKSCGCFKTRVAKRNGNNNKTHGETKTRLYNIWRGIKKRCLLPNDTSYEWYGAKGITICDEWLESYEVFREWALKNGYEDNLSIDRVDNNGNYEPSNCRWITMKEQENNRTNNVVVEFRGYERTLAQIAEELGESREMIWYRYRNGISFETPKKLVNR